MTTETAKAAALEALLAGPFTPGPGDSRAPAIHLLKHDGVPVVSENIGTSDAPQIRHRLVDTALTTEEVKARRTEGLADALRIHRHEKPREWRRLVDAIPCPFARDAADEYLRAIATRQRAVAKMQ